MFWGDESGQKYFDAYFARFDNAWTQADFVMIHPMTGGVYMLGRADGVLNPSGVRFGSAEVSKSALNKSLELADIARISQIYSVIEAFFSDDIQDSVCVGQRRPSDTDESVMLFLLMKPGRKFSEKLVKEVRDRIARECSKRHAPKYVFETPEIPVSTEPLRSRDAQVALTV